MLQVLHRRTLRPTRLVLLTAVLAVTVSAAVGAPPVAAVGSSAHGGAQDPPEPGAPVVAAPGGRIVVVGDSIMKGAAGRLEAAFRAAGQDVVVDTDVSRSTVAGAGVVADHLANGGADAVVVMLGANDGGNPDSYRDRVRSVVAATSLVPRIYWLTIPEVRNYYPAANQVVREELALRPGAEVLDWSAVSSSPGTTGGDGLHLTPAGADAMAWFVSANVLADLEADAVAATSTTTSTSASTTTTPASPSSTTTTDGRDSNLPAGSQDPGPAGGGDGGVPELAREGERAAETSIWGVAAGTGLAVTALVGVLGILGASLAVWALWRTRGAA